jgi:hypothetical protein
MNTFKTDSCKIIKSGARDQLAMKEVLAVAIGKNNTEYNDSNKKLRARIEAVSCPEKTMEASTYNSFVASCFIAFEQHKRLILSPDIIWLAIVQQLAIHVNNHSEDLRKEFVAFEGKKSILIERDDFKLGADNPWHNVFPEFTARIKEYIGDSNYDTIIGNFSTTDATAKVAFEISMMDVVKSYFDYGMKTMCGIPEITLEGTTEDWQLILKKAKGLSKYKLDWWLESLIPVLEQFIAASEDNIDSEFWQSFFKLNEGSGGPYINGHINKFFPYVKGGYQKENTFVPNRCMNSTRQFGGSTTDSFPSGIASVPFIWLYYEEKLPMGFISGFMGMERTNESVKPNIGWGVLHRVAGEAEFKKECERFENGLKEKANV